MSAKQSTNKNDAFVRADNAGSDNQPPLTEEELERLVRVLSDPGNRAGIDLLTFSGVSTMPGLLTRLLAAEPEERELLVRVIRKVLLTVA